MIIITDLDGTLARSRWRADLRDDGWDVYHEASRDDEPNTPIVELIRTLAEGNKIICVTSRPEKYRQITLSWLLKYRVTVDELYMRFENDYRSSDSLKYEIAKALELDASKVIAIDDRPDTLAKYRELGFTTLLTEEV